MRTVFLTFMVFHVTLTLSPVLKGEEVPKESAAQIVELTAFSGGQLTDDKKGLRLTGGYATLDGPNDWSGYDSLIFETDLEADEPTSFTVEIRDTETKGYWTRVNYLSIIPPGKSTFTLPLNQLYVGEKSRPGRNLLLDRITRFVLVLDQQPKGAVTFSNMRLVRNEAPPMFDGLWAFDFGLASGPVMDGFTQITPATQYSEARGFGLKDAKIWRAFDMLQPEPLYQDCIAIESGGLAVDLPNGKYRVVLNLNHPGGFWGENQIYHERTVLANGTPVVQDTMDGERFYQWYFRFFDQDDLPTDNTFDKYQKDAYQEKIFDVEIKDGQLFLEFCGANWANCVSSVILFPTNRMKEGEDFLKYVTEKRRFYFDNYFKRVLRRPTGDPPATSREDERRGYIVFKRDFMEDVYYNDTPWQGERTEKFSGDAFAGEYEPITFSLVPLRDLGTVSVKVSDLKGTAGTIPTSAIDVGYVSYRLSRVTMEGSVYTIAPRLIMPRAQVDMPKDITRTFWLTVKAPADVAAGLYAGKITITENGRNFEMPLTFLVRNGTLDDADIPVGPWGHSIEIPWKADATSRELYEQLKRASLAKIREYGFNCATGIPTIPYRGFTAGRPILDFTQADADMKLLRELGYRAVCDYGTGIQGINKYLKDEAAMRAAGKTDYSEFVRSIYTDIQQHAEAANWIPVYYYLADEPVDDAMAPSIANAEAYKKAFPTGPPFFTVASSYAGNDPNDPHLRFAKACHVVSWNTHSEDSLRLLHEAGGAWAFYNGSNRWTMGDYMYKCVREYAMKFRLVWHYNCAAGNPYYALDSREDDYAWANASPDGTLILSMEFERLREGLEDYRRLITLERLAQGKGDEAGKQLIEERMKSFRIGQRDHDKIFPMSDWREFRSKVSEAIERLQ